jgi:hypothetical protein
MNDPCVPETIVSLEDRLLNDATWGAGRGDLKIEYSRHFFTRSRTIINSTYCATMGAVSGFHRAGSHSRAYKRPMIFGNLSNVLSSDLAMTCAK